MELLLLLGKRKDLEGLVHCRQRTLGSLRQHDGKYLCRVHLTP